MVVVNNILCNAFHHHIIDEAKGLVRLHLTDHYGARLVYSGFRNILEDFQQLQGGYSSCYSVFV